MLPLLARHVNVRYRYLSAALTRKLVTGQHASSRQLRAQASPPNELTKHTHEHFFFLSFTNTFLFIKLNTTQHHPTAHSQWPPQPAPSPPRAALRTSTS
jgi:hypothetical protein